MTPTALTVSSLHTIGGTSLAVLILAQLVKRTPRIQRVSKEWLSVIIAELIFGLTSPTVPTSISEWTTMLMNGALAAAAATGSSHLILYMDTTNEVSTKRVNEVVKSAADVDCIGAFLKAIIRNQTLNHARKYRRWCGELLILDAPNEFDETMLEQLPSADAEQAFRDSEVGLLINGMPHPDRDVLYDLIILGRSEKDVAKELHVSQRRVSRIKQHAIHSLRQELSGP